MGGEGHADPVPQLLVLRQCRGSGRAVQALRQGQAYAFYIVTIQSMVWAARRGALGVFLRVGSRRHCRVGGGCPHALGGDNGQQFEAGWPG